MGENREEDDWPQRPDCLFLPFRALTRNVPFLSDSRPPPQIFVTLLKGGEGDRRWRPFAPKFIIVASVGTSIWPHFP